MNAMRVIAGLLLFSWALAAADITGIWMGEVAGRNGEKQDLAFQFQTAKGAVTGVMFGDEFDLPVQDLKLDGDHVTFSVETINYYDGRRIRTAYKGTLSENILELTREQVTPDASGKQPEKPKEPAPKLVLKRLT
jgi:hypothetical protein